MTSNACIAAVKQAAEGKLTGEELESVFEVAQRIRKRLVAEGEVDRLADRVKEEVAAHADRTRIAAALQRKHAALNIIVRDRLQNHLTSLQSEGLSPDKAMLAVRGFICWAGVEHRHQQYALHKPFIRSNNVGGVCFSKRPRMGVSPPKRQNRAPFVA